MLRCSAAASIALARGCSLCFSAAAASIFFAYVGFDAVSTAAEETKNPGRDLSIGYSSHTDSVVRLYLEESLTFLLYTAEAAVALIPGADDAAA